ncbi:hypothetical protein ACFSC6_15445 [Rufibacter sediminis]|uniref:GMT-like wHTH domain-containing protein n=1 Tax=Rufibacter sediminis TaxID=2762756 RepID=A0ABR6VW73_9BACT|nr:hypothetical protein [Rufibacter sediminis]MBC3541430.1 hypothetical protein [Rufibacter sediminis]
MKEVATGTDPKEFFKQKRSTAELKEEIFLKFFPLWCETLFYRQEAVEKVLYLDTSAGLGAEEDGEMPVSFKVLKSIFARTGGRQDLNKVVQPFLYEGNKALAATLPQAAEALPFYAELHQKPLFLNLPEHVEMLQAQEPEATAALLLVDPFGNKFSQELWTRSLAHEKTDSFLLFDYKRMTAALREQKSPTSLQTLLGDRLPELRSYFAKTTSAAKKETYALKAFSACLQEKGLQTSRFRINVPGKEQSSHHVWFVSRNELAHTKFKELLLPYCEVQEDGVPVFGANLKTVRLLVPEYSRYLEFSLVNLMEDLVQHASVYNSMMLEKIYQKHSVGKPYSRENYQTAIEKLKEQGKITLLNPKTGQVVYKLTYACRIKFKG